MLEIAVEGKSDEPVVAHMLRAAGISEFEVFVANAGLDPKKFEKRWRRLGYDRPAIVVYDQESGSVGDAVRKDIGTEAGVQFCPAIPTIEAWLFADSEAFFHVLGDKAEPFHGRMPLPEQLPYPRFLRSTVLRDKNDYKRLLDSIDIHRASTRSPSLRYFIQTARSLSGLPPLDLDLFDFQTSQRTREVLRNLISEVYPSSKALFRSASGAVFSAEAMMQEITDGTALGREYASDVLRVARDLLARQAQKPSRLSEGDE